ncbi:hypothetical protein C0Q70_06457 [Pomacea canaliculata]|uniref:AIG1-type G domain-containing protein n=1 Tax=Pomacea canaliculata TaxID=400727 RepID=A0A2T7PP24_POMCA|nr:GTPase IMAP family member 7-like isoform X1 [Pomacea canaliculata]PVD35176.1 hypothetical protein C0Q70_06457 [Pomacea canaliculata]
MGDNQDLEEWATSVDLDSATVVVLKEEGFTNLELLRHLTADHVTENLQKSKRLPLAQCLALKSAIKMFANESSAGLETAKSSEVADSRHEPTTDHLTASAALGEEGNPFRILKVGSDSDPDLIQLKSAERNGVTVEYLDSPGLFDTRKGPEAVATAIAKSVAGMYPGLHALIYIIEIGQYTEEDEGKYNRLLELFDKNLARYTIVLFTSGGRFSRVKKVEDMLANAPESLKRVLSACQNRYVDFSDGVVTEVFVLMQKVRELVAANGGKPYTCPKYFHIGEAMEEEVRKKMAKVEKQHLQSKQYVQQLEAKAKQAEEAVAREKEEFEKKEQARQKEMKELEAKKTAQLESLKQQLEQQQMSEDKRRRKTEAFLKKLEEDWRQQVREMEEDRKWEQENLNRKEEEMNTMIESRIEEERKLREEMARAHDEEMTALRERIVDGQEPSFLNYVMTPFVQLIEDVCNLMTKLASDFGGD